MEHETPPTVRRLDVRAKYWAAALNLKGIHKCAKGTPVGICHRDSFNLALMFKGGLQTQAIGP